jgi:hypothetical protein
MYREYQRRNESILTRLLIKLEHVSIKQHFISSTKRCRKENLLFNMYSISRFQIMEALKKALFGLTD